MKKNIVKIGIAVALVGIPLLSFAAGKDLKTIMDIITGYMANFIKLVIAFAILTFVWNIYRYFLKADADRAEAGKYVLYSVIGFFVMLSIWGLVNIVKNTFNLDNQNPGWPFDVGSGFGGSSNNSNSGFGGTSNNYNTGFGGTSNNYNTGFGGTSNNYNTNANGGSIDPSLNNFTDTPYDSNSDVKPTRDQLFPNTGANEGTNETQDPTQPRVR